MTKIISDDIDECDTSTDFIDCSSTANTTPIHIDRSADTDSNCNSMTHGSTRRMMTRRRHSKLLRFHGASLVLMFMIASILLFVDSMTTTCCCYAAMNDNHDMLHQTHHHTDDATATTPQRRLLMRNDPSINKKKNRILYIITALAEYNSGTRNTVRGSDRLQETLIPVVSEGVTSMIKDGYDVDVFLVAHFILQPERAALITKALPENVGFDYWNEATPLGYDTGSNKLDRTLENRTLHLARQHRFVIKDKLMQYDIFVVFEDDMLITADHVNHYVAVTNELRRLEELAPVDVPPSTTSSKSPITTKDEVLQQYHGTMTKGQLRRMIPGFMRVEVLLDEEHYPAQSKTGPIPVDLLFTKDGKQSPEATTVNATSCCYISDHLSNENRPGQPNADQLMIWETNILPLGIRKMPTDSWLDWVVLQRGPNQNDLNVNETIGDYWSNRNADYYGPKEKRPAPQEFKYINNMGGWMATREQLYVPCYITYSCFVEIHHFNCLIIFSLSTALLSTDGDGIPKFVRVDFYHRTRDLITSMMDWICGMWNGIVVGCNYQRCDMPATCNVSYYWNRSSSVNHYCIIPPTTSNDNSLTNVKELSQRRIRY